jgi:acyl-CoA-dependent ceramide synthase
MRHYLNLRILVSEFFEFKTIGPYGVVWETEQYKGPLAHYISTALLGSLQALNLFWLFAIFRIAYRFLFHNALADDRSDYEDEEELEAEKREERELMEREREELRRLEKQTPMPEIMVNGAKVEAKVEAKASGAQGKAKAKVARRKA